MQNLQRIFPLLLTAFLVGVGLASTIGYPWAWSLCFLLVSLLTFFFWVFTRRDLYIFFCIIFAMGSLGALRYEVWLHAGVTTSSAYTFEEQMMITGIVSDEPDARETNTHLVVKPRTVNGEAWITDGRILLFAPKYPEFHYGDEITIQGKLKRPEPFGDPGKREFDYPMYLAVKDIHAIMFFPDISFIKSGEGNVVVTKLFQLKSYLLAQLSQLYPEPQNALLAGLMLGGKQSLGEEWLEIFTRAGVIHIVVLSGYNMTIVAEWLVSIFRFLGFYGSLSVGGVGIVLFMIMTGAGATVLRAGVMALIALFARASGRTYTMGRALLVAGTLMVLHDPGILLYDPSFQLSFLASLGLVLVAPIIDASPRFLPRARVLREVVVSTLATQVMVLPLLLYQTGVLSLVALPANLLILPLIPLTMLFGFIALVVSVILPPLAPISALPGNILLSYILGASRVASGVPFATVDTTFTFLMLVVAYAVIGMWIYRAGTRVGSTVSPDPSSRSATLLSPTPNKADDKIHRRQHPR